MISITIDNRPVEVNDGATILEAAEKIGIHIPTMCHLPGCTPSTSCMVCVVRVNGANSFVPACGTVAVKGMNVESQTPEVLQARRTALELLLSDHVGDCMGPCQVSCPGKMDIPLMIRQIADGKLTDAIRTIKKDIPLPAVLGRICPAPCERVCRRAQHDQPLAICLLKRYAADVDLESTSPYLPAQNAAKNKTVAVIGAGPAGLSAAYYLSLKGYTCTVYDDKPIPGGGLLAEELTTKLDPKVLAREIKTLTAAGLQILSNKRVGADISWKQIADDFDAAFIATGGISAEDAKLIDIEMNGDQVNIDKATYATSRQGWFAGGNVAGPKRHLAIRATADGKEAAYSIDQFLSEEKVTGPAKPFNIRMGKLQPGEMELFMAHADKRGQVLGQDIAAGLSDEQARLESIRCLHCDCRKAKGCKLRTISQSLGAKANAHKAPRRTFEQFAQHDLVIYEPGKCIDCGLCIQIAEQQGEKLGLTFVGRGFDVRVAVPFGESIAVGLKQASEACAKACPTGAIALR